MRTIWKYELGGGKITEVEAPQGAQFLHATVQPNPEKGIVLVVWALVDPEAPKQTRRLLGVATGEPFEDALADAGRHISTVQVMARVPDGFPRVEVVHIFEVLL
jgi:hypothetical protein